MKVLITTDTFYPMINGVVISTNNLYKELKNRGHDVRIMTLSDSGIERTEGDVYYLESINTNIYPGAKIKKPLGRGLINEIIKWKPDIVHSQTEFSTFITAKSIAKKLDIPHLHTYHTMYEDYLNYIFGGKLIKPKMAAVITKFLLNSMDGIVTPTEKVKSVIKGYGIECENYIVPTGINIKKFDTEISDEEKRELLCKHGLSEQDRILVYVGRIAEEKNIEEIILYFSKVINKIENTKLLIVGGGPYLENLKMYTQKLSIQNYVCFAGMVKPEEVCKYYKLGSVFVTGSTSETQGLTYIEAMASGLPVVCRFDSCVENLVINLETGFAYNDEEEFRIAVENIIENNSLRKKLSENVKIKAEEYSCETFGKNIEKIYIECLENNHNIKSSKWHQIIDLKRLVS